MRAATSDLVRAVLVGTLLLILYSCAHTARIDELAFRVDVATQRGRGIQSQAGVEVFDGVSRGSEAAGMALPRARVGIRQNDRIRHLVDMSVDIVTSASADALDAVSQASLWTEATAIDGRTNIDATDDDRVELRWGLHLEETMRSGFGGLAYRRELANDNAVIEVRGGLIIDTFDAITPQGIGFGQVVRQTAHASFSASQILSPTTWVDASYGLTYQWGALATTWNGIPFQDGGSYGEERLPPSRLRHALTGGLAQFVPATRSALRARYRFYSDDFNVRAHTVNAEWLQWIGKRVYLRLGYRFHRQNAVSFFVSTLAPSDRHRGGAPRTSDSDLAAYDAHEWSTQLVVYLSRNGPRGSESINFGFARYSRPHLRLHLFGLGYSRHF